MSKKVAELLNTQINNEMYSAYLYLDMAVYYEKQGLSRMDAIKAAAKDRGMAKSEFYKLVAND